jgi:hypothetical protein
MNEFHSDNPELVEGLLDICQHVRFRRAFSDQIVNVNLQVPAYLALEGLVHQPLVCGSDVL